MTDQITARHDIEQVDEDDKAWPPEDPETGFTYITREEGERLIDRQAQKYLGMSGVEFKQRYRAGTMDPERSEVIRVAMLLPFGKD